MKNYAWIQPIDHTINGKEWYRSYVLDATLDDNLQMVLTLREYFPVGSIFHAIHSDVYYVIKSQDISTHKNVYKVCRDDGKEMTLDDVHELKTKRYIFRSGFEHRVC